MNHDLDLLISFLQPIKELLLDDSVSEIMGNPNGQWWFERRGRLEHAETVLQRFSRPSCGPTPQSRFASSPRPGSASPTSSKAVL